jgi:mono/diheme cytochrome c family protein
MRASILASLVLALGLFTACGDDDADGHGHDGGGRSEADAAHDAGGETDSGGGGSGGNADAVARGEYLVNVVAVCIDCHTPRDAMGQLDESKFLSGVECFVDADPADPEVGCLSTRNLTNHETGLKNRTDQEIKDLFTKGERPDGKALHPFMPYWVLGNMSDEDADAIVAYLRTVPGVDHMLPDNQPPFEPGAMPAPRFPEAKIPMPSDDYADKEAAMRGRYLAGNVGVCMECHTPRLMVDGMEIPDVDRAFQGGAEFPAALLGLPAGVFPEVIYSSNITPHANGIDGWTLEDIVNALKKGEDADQMGAPLCPPMPAGPMGPFANLTDADAEDLAHYLLSIPPGDNMVPEDCSPMMGPPPGDGGTPDGG